MKDATYDPSKDGQRNPCPHCHAFRGRPCTTTRGAPIRTIHKVRADLETQPEKRDSL